MRILHCSPSLSLVDGGIARAVHDLISVFDRRGHETELLVSGAADIPAHWKESAQVRFHKTKSGLINATGGVARDSTMVNAIQRASLVHIHVPWSALSIAVGAACRRLGVPYCVSLHGCLDDWPMSQRAVRKRLALSLFVRRLLESAAFVHCTAEEEQRQSHKWFPRGTVRVVPCVMDLASFQRLPGPELARLKLGLEPSRRMVFHIGRIHPKKGLLCLVRAMPEIIAAHDVWLCVAGPEEDKRYASEVKQEIRKLNLSDRVRFLGNISDTKVKMSLLQAAAVTVLPSSQENFGFVMFETLLCQSPLVTTNLIDTWRELQRHGNARICDLTPSSLAHSVNAALSIPQSLSSVTGLDGRNWALSFLSEDRVGSLMEVAYREAVGS
jgi:glycosyltransferase involved in cell wall biosynthesis